MKILIPVILAAFVLVGCDKQKAAIDDNATATKTAIDQEKKDVNAIKMELELFHKSITQNKPVPVSVLDGYNAMHVAHQILDKINAQLVVKK